MYQTAYHMSLNLKTETRLQLTTGIISYSYWYHTTTFCTLLCSCCEKQQCFTCVLW